MKEQIDGGKLKRTGRQGMPGAAEVAKRVTVAAREMGIHLENDITTQTVFNWLTRGVPGKLLPAVAEMMGISPKEYLRLARAQSPDSPSARKLHAVVKPD